MQNLIIELLVGIFLLIVGYLLGLRQSNINWERELLQRQKEHEEQLKLLSDQLEEQRKQREFAEQTYKDASMRKVTPTKWNIQE